MHDVASMDANIQTLVFDAVCETLAAGVVIYDKNDCLIWANRHIRRFFPVDPKFLTPGTRLRDLLGALFDAGIRYGLTSEQRHRTINREEWITSRISAHWREQYDVTEKFGKDRWVRFRKRRLPSGYNVSTLTDVSEHTKQEEQWRSDLARVAITEEILETLPFPVFVKDRNLSYIATNRAFCEIHGTTGDAVLGRTVWDIADAEQALRIEDSDRTVLETGKPFRVAEHIVKADGSDLYVITRKYRIGSPDHQLLVTYMEDVSGIVFHNADGASCIRSSEVFVEAQNCLDPAIEAERQLILQQLNTEEFGDLAQKRVLVATADGRLERLLVDELGRRGADACAVRSESEFMTFAAAAAQWGVVIDLVLVDDTMPGHAAVLQSRAVRQSRVLSADKVGPHALDVIGYEPEPLGDSKARADVSGVGAIFSDDWYIATDVAALPAASAGDVDVLVAEDNQINQFVFSQILESIGVSHRIAENGEEAVLLWRRYQPKLILMDISMPVKDGLEATLEIRREEKETGSYTPIVAVTAQALNVDMQNCMDVGMDDYITKPVSPDMIESIYRRYVLEKQKKSAA
ncbi:response regulator [Rhizobium sp. TRM95111]|uniref:response regulator n=1 Tax=Rhizobium alarense TaxID=2846851 RepID=UPI001F1FA822|nr:response regulator [Rhizobium alarense]MCF3642280.1 response regulator [Rhizobium alarense]